jgi:hypothetical protein
LRRRLVLLPRARPKTLSLRGQLLLYMLVEQPALNLHRVTEYCIHRLLLLSIWDFLVRCWR